MNIALFTETYLPYINGVVTHVKALKDGLEKMNHNVLIVTADVNTKKHYIKDGVLWCPAREVKRVYEYGLANPISFTRLRILKQFKPDIIHIHNEFGVGLSGVKIAKRLKVPVVYTLHTMYDDYLYYISPKKLLPVAQKVSHRYLRYLANRATAITGPSIKVQEYLNECGVVKNVNVVPNPVELDKFDISKAIEDRVKSIKEEYNLDGSYFVMAFCGRLGREKSVDVLLDYFAKTVKKEDKIKLLILGDGPCKEELEKLSKELKIDDIVYFSGKVLHDDLINYYACCDMYVTASLSDTNSISMLEAMATGLPVLHILDELNEGQVIEGVNGFIYNNANEMYQKIIAYKNMSDEEKHILKCSVIESVKKSGQENLANYLLDVYTHLDNNKENKIHPKIFELGLFSKVRNIKNNKS